MLRSGSTNLFFLINIDLQVTPRTPGTSGPPSHAPPPVPKLGLHMTSSTPISNMSPSAPSRFVTKMSDHRFSNKKTNTWVRSFSNSLHSHVWFLIRPPQRAPPHVPYSHPPSHPPPDVPDANRPPPIQVPQINIVVFSILNIDISFLKNLNLIVITPNQNQGDWFILMKWLFFKKMIRQAVVVRLHVPCIHPAIK